MWRSIGAVLNRWSCFFLRCTLPLSLILHELGRRFMKTNYTTSAREMIFTLTGGEYNLRYFLRYFQIFVYYSQVTQSRQFFLQSWATEIRAFMKGPETAKNQVLLNHRQMKPSCLASRIYYGGTSFSIRQTRKKGATLVQVPFLRWRVRGFISFGNRHKHWVESLRIGVFLRALPAAALSTDRGQPFVESLRSED